MSIKLNVGDPLLFVKKAISDTQDSFLHDSRSAINLTREDLYLHSNINKLENIWNYLHEIVKKIPLRDEHLTAFANYNKVVTSELDNIVDADALTVLNSELPNTTMEKYSNNDCLDLKLTLPPILYDYYKWSWVITVYDFIKNDNVSKYIEDKHTFLYNAPRDMYFTENNLKRRAIIEKEILGYIYELGSWIESYAPDVYADLGHTANMEAIPNIRFSNTVIIQEDDEPSVLMTLPFDDFGKRIEKLCELIEFAKTGCATFVTKYESIPTKVLKSRLSAGRLIKEN